MKVDFIDIHTHTFYSNTDTLLLLNVFPSEKDKLRLPCYKSVGLHPWHIQPASLENELKIVGDTVNNEWVIAIGETGLDKACSTDFVLQTNAFLGQLAIARNCMKPVVIHCVRSYSEIMGIRKKTGLLNPWIFHWYNADEQTATQLIRKNCFLSFGHMLFKNESKAYRVFQKTDLDFVFFETDDAGYTISEVYAMAAKIRNLEMDELQKRILHNFERCFNIRINGTLVKPD